MKAALFLFLFLSFNLAIGQSIKVIESQINSILKAKSVEEKLARNCRMARLIPSAKVFDLENDRILQEPDYNQISNFKDLMEEKNRLRVITWSFPLKDGYHQYNLSFSCRTDLLPPDENGIVKLSRTTVACDNELDLDCRPCVRGSCSVIEWDGYVYTKMSSSYQDSVLYLNMKGERYDKSDTNYVEHVFSVSQRCKIEFLGEAKSDAVR